MQLFHSCVRRPHYLSFIRAHAHHGELLHLSNASTLRRIQTQPFKCLLSNRSRYFSSSGAREIDREFSSNVQVTALQSPKAGGEGQTQVASSELKSVLVANLPWAVTSDRLAEEFADCGQVIAARIVVERDTLRPRGFGFIDFADAQGADNALMLDGEKYIDDRLVKIVHTKSRPRGSKNHARSLDGVKPSKPTNVLYVGNTGYYLTTDELRTHFNDFGVVKSVRVPSGDGTFDETTTSNGYAFVEFLSASDVERILEDERAALLNGRRLRLCFAKRTRSGQSKDRRQDGRVDS